MLKAILARFRQGHRTIKYPDAPQPLPPRFRGLPLLDASRCDAGCRACAAACPYGAISESGPLKLDMGMCLFCGECTAVCQHNAISFTQDARLASRTRDALTVAAAEEYRPAKALEGKLLRLFGRSLKLREVSAGGCNACEADTNVLSTIGWDLGRFGIQFVASPRHADGMFVTGPVSENMRLALLDTYVAIPEPKLVIVAGACAINGGPFKDHSEVHNGADGVVPVDLYIPGCPPSPLTILDGLLRLVGRIQD
ncbi:MAG: 4Fe-4S binding protein [Desulfuromonadaceae bacterium]|nr:4Fe-4S binding protein [Desulfuromonadaceae bacterium]MDD5107319.1 4Fe-4S binding protein [Desulfuromonadaceae bacterium]